MGTVHHLLYFSEISFVFLCCLNTFTRFLVTLTNVKCPFFFSMLPFRFFSSLNSFRNMTFYTFFSPVKHKLKSWENNFISCRKEILHFYIQSVDDSHNNILQKSFPQYSPFPESDLGCDARSASLSLHTTPILIRKVWFPVWRAARGPGSRYSSPSF